MEWKDRRVCVIGCGKSGIGAAQFLCGLGADVVLFDANKELTEEQVREKMPADLKVQICLGELADEIAQGIDVLVPSPGVPVDSPMVEAFVKRGIPVWGEIEIAYTQEKGQVVAITGTNGKTTTTTLMGEIMKTMGETFVVGNIGTPYTDKVCMSTKASVTVAEISSFQLETIDTFHPKVSAILNITPDHLNRHHTMENYAAIKNAITKNQTKEDTCVLNYENEYTRAFGEHCNASVIYFSSERVLERGVYQQGEEILMNLTGTPERVMNIHDMNLVGTCNIENVCAAIAMSEAMGVPREKYLKTIREFKAVEHRIEYTATVDGVDYYNDSKGTNPDAAIQGIKAMSKPTILIGGGYDKGNTYDEWIEAFDGKVKLLVLIGQTREDIAACARKHGFDKIVMADTFEECFKICVEHALPGDAVLLSPACASWGMFPNYEVRGEQFKEMVHALEH
ncbi:MAG: UDP-N-acetylmuramoyl-L-alanine--D-glutamate ligase [Lachnospiraceae bacterium]|nr:UDP-N-acetylmuramoyl-L-alanine--D-glutamate ligase [Lachnospiraceae bacterium]